MPQGKGTYGKKVGRPPKKVNKPKKGGMKKGLTAKQKKLPKKLQEAIMKKMKK